MAYESTSDDRAAQQDAMNRNANPISERSRSARPSRATELREDQAAQAFIALRRAAEVRIKESAATRLPETKVDQQRHRHELEVNQIELELQNDELRQTQTKLETALERYADFYDFGSAGYMTLRADGTVQQANLTAVTMLEIDRSQLMNRRFGMLVAAESVADFNALLARAFDTRKPQTGEVRLFIEGKSPLTIQLRAWVSKNHSECRMVLTDLTERKRAEDALRDMHWRLESILKGACVGTWEWNVQTGEMVFNEVWTQMLGYTLDELSPITLKTWKTLVQPDDLKQAMELAGRHFAGELPNYECEYRMQHKDGHWVWIHDSGRVITCSGDGRPLMMFGTHTDITRRKRAEDELRHLSARLLRLRDDERRQMARELHDVIGQNLAALGMNLSFLEKVVPRLRPEARQALLDSEALADQTAKDVRTFSYLLHPPLLEELGLGGALQDYVPGFARRSGIRVDLELPPEFGRMPQETELALFRVIQESLTNIHRHSGSKTACITLNQTTDEVQLEVRDAGRGFALTPSESAGPASALGVGILGMQERLRQLGGRLHISSNSGGTIVRATLPCARKATDNPQ